MADRSIFVTLGLRADGFKREASSAADALSNVGDAGDKASRKSAGGFKDLGKQVQENSAELRTLGTGMVTVGASMLGVTAAVAKTGLEYNVLRQSSTAALSTLLGGAKQAKAQMDKLDDFALTSPYARQSLIKAQQMMLAFGIETQKVIPYLGAVQDAVAAMGGSSQDVEMVVEILAKMKAQGRVTAQELRQLGLHGVDAATLIGNSMGKTADQIRDMIRAGELDGNTALDALVDGMQTRFGGAAAAVKDGFVGALDRVKAAFRDFSSSAMTPFVDPDGGGWLVGWANSLADGIRLLDKLPGSVKTATVVMGGLGGAALTAAGTFLLLAPRIVATKAALDTLRASEGILGSLGRGLGTLGRLAGPVGLAVSAAFAGIAVSNKPINDAIALTNAYSESLLNLRDSGLTSSQAMQATARDLVGLKDGFDGWAGMEKWWVGFDSLADILDASKISYQSFFDAIEQGGPVREQFVEQLRAAFKAGLIGSNAFNKVVEVLNEHSDAAQGAADGLDDYEDATRDASDGADVLADSTTMAAEAAEAAEAAYQGYLDALSALVSFQDGMVDSFLKGRDAQRKLTEATAEFGETTEMTDEIMDGYAGTVRDSIQDMAQARDANGDLVWSTEELQGMMQSAREAIIDAATAMDMGSEEAELLADSYGLIPELVETWVELHTAQAEQAAAEIDEALGGIPPEVISQIIALGGPEAEDIAARVKQAVEVGIPPEKIVDILTNEDVTMQGPIITQAIHNITPSKTVTIKGQDNASGVIAGVERQLRNINGSTATVYVRSVSTGVREFSPGYGGGTQVRAAGGPVFGAGTETSDSIPVWMSHNEHVLTAAEVRAAGGHGNVFALRSMMKTGELARMMGFADGGSPAARPMRVPGSVAGSSVTVVINDYSTTNSPVQVPETVARAEQLQKVGALVGGLV